MSTMIKYINAAIAKKYSGKTCVMRIDLNVDPKTEEGMFRLRSVIPTIKLLRSNKITVVLVSHKGRPTPAKNGAHPSAEDQKLSLKPYAKIIGAELKEGVRFIPSFNFEEVSDEIEAMKEGVALLENVRFCSGEEKNDKKLGKLLSGLGQFYVNDAFAVSHRAHASVAAITSFLPSYGGLQLEKEMSALLCATKTKEHPFVLILGGAKTADKLPLLEKFRRTADYFLMGGGPANTLLAAQGIPMGESLYDEKLVKQMRGFAFASNVITPTDTAGKGAAIYDIGPETAMEYAEIIRSAKAIIWNGPMGVYEKSAYAKGTVELWKAVAGNKKACTVVGGGETIASLHRAKNVARPGKNVFMSTGGGAMLEFVSGKKLPGLVCLGFK